MSRGVAGGPNCRGRSSQLTKSRTKVACSIQVLSKGDRNTPEFDADGNVVGTDVEKWSRTSGRLVQDMQRYLAIADIIRCVRGERPAAACDLDCNLSVQICDGTSVTANRPELFKRATQTFGSEPDCQIRANSTSAAPLVRLVREVEECWGVSPAARTQSCGLWDRNFLTTRHRTQTTSTCRTRTTILYRDRDRYTRIQVSRVLHTTRRLAADVLSRL